jgi:hypothetical protein
MAFHYRSTATMSTAVITTKEFKGIGHKQHCATCQHWMTNIKHHSQQFVPALGQPALLHLFIPVGLLKEKPRLYDLYVLHPHT